jgi:hypothetical protein
MALARCGSDTMSESILDIARLQGTVTSLEPRERGQIEFQGRIYCVLPPEKI